MEIKNAPSHAKTRDEAIKTLHGSTQLAHTEYAPLYKAVTGLGRRVLAALKGW